MQALLAQLASEPGDTAANAARAAEALERWPQADIAVFPELFLGGYGLDVEATARPAGCDELRTVAQAAARTSTAVVIGFTEALPDGAANAVACIDRDGTLAGVYRKVQLFGREREAFRRGRELLVVELAGRRVGPLVCFDVEFPELARWLAQAGADLLVTASANMEPFYADHELATRARALENRLPHLYANAVGTSGPHRFVGGSRSIGPDGTVVAELPAAEEGLLLAPVGDAGTDDERVDYLRHLPEPLTITTP
jgi:predicted amidohydrolase